MGGSHHGQEESNRPLMGYLFYRVCQDGERIVGQKQTLNVQRSSPKCEWFPLVLVLVIVIVSAEGWTRRGELLLLIDARSSLLRLPSPTRVSL